LHNELKFPPGTPISGGDRVDLVLISLDNPTSPGPGTFSVGTSSDSAVQVDFRTAPSVAVHSLSVLSLSTRLGGATEVTYTFRFTTSGGGALDATYGRIDVTGPDGAFPGCATGTLTDLTSNKSSPVFDCGAQIGDLHNQVDFPPEVPISGGDEVEVVLTHVDNPTSPGAHVLIVGTSSNLPLRAVFQTEASAELHSLSVSRSDDTRGAIHVTYTVDFTTSPGGTLVIAIGTIDIKASPGTFPPACLVGTVTDLTTSTSAALSDCGATVGTNGAEVDFPIPMAVGGGDRVQLVLKGLNNPKAPGPDNFTVATSSDAARSVSL